MRYKDGHGEEGWHKVFSAPLIHLSLLLREPGSMCRILCSSQMETTCISQCIHLFLLNNISFILERALAPTLVHSNMLIYMHPYPQNCFSQGHKTKSKI